MFFFLAFRWHLRLFFLFGERFSRGESKTQIRFAGAKQGATKDGDEPFVGLGDLLKGGWRCFSTFFGPDLGASSTSLCSQSWDFFGMLINAHPPSTFPLACQHLPKKLFKIPVDVVSSFKLQHGSQRLKRLKHEEIGGILQMSWCLLNGRLETPWMSLNIMVGFL